MKKRCYSMNSTGSITGRLDRKGTLWVFGTGVLDIPHYYQNKGWKRAKRVVTSGSISEIGKSAFSLPDVEEILINAAVKRIGTHAFSNCTKLRRIILPEGVEELGAVPFGYNPRLEAINFPDSLTKWDNAVCFKCPSLKRVVLPKNVKNIPWEGFAYCTSLEEVVLPEGLEVIQDNAFFECTNLTRIVIPTSVRLIQRLAFAYCYELKEVIFLGERPQIESDAFIHTKVKL